LHPQALARTQQMFSHGMNMLLALIMLDTESEIS
jgi:hypothetical protein